MNKTCSHVDLESWTCFIFFRRNSESCLYRNLKKNAKPTVLCSHSKNICHHELYEDTELIKKVNENIKSNFN